MLRSAEVDILCQQLGCIVEGVILIISAAAAAAATIIIIVILLLLTKNLARAVVQSDRSRIRVLLFWGNLKPFQHYLCQDLYDYGHLYGNFTSQLHI